jgi:hypothetical protein
MDDGMGQEAANADSAAEDTAGDASPAPRVSLTNVVGVVLRGYGLTARHFLPLLIPTATLVVPAGVLGVALIVAAVGYDAVLVDGELRPLSFPPDLVAALVATAAIVLATYLVALAATVVMSAGLLLGRPVRPGAALRAVARRPVTLTAATAMVAAFWALAAVAGIAVAAWSGMEWAGGILAVVVVLLAGWWLTLVLPIALLEGLGTWRSVARALSVSRGRRTRNAVALTLGQVVVPGLFIAGVRWAVSPLDGTADVVLGDTALLVASLLVVPFQAGILAVVALNQRYLDSPGNRPDTGSPYRSGEPLDLGGIIDRLGPGTGRGRTRWAMPLVVLLPLPGLLIGLYSWRNPLGLPTDHPIDDSFGNVPAALHLLSGDRPAGILPGPDALVCDDRDCGRDRRFDSGLATRADMGTVTLPDGTVAVATWGSESPAATAYRPGPQVLRLLRCDADGCGSPRSAPIADRGDTDADRFYAAAMTVTRDGLLIAAVVPERLEHELGIALRVRLIHCADMRCAAPRTVTLLRRLYGAPNDGTPIAVAVGPDGRPVVAFQDDDSHQVSVISCDSVECGHPRVTELPLPLDRPAIGDVWGPNDVDITVPPDGRPVLTYRHEWSGAVRLVRCRAFDDCTDPDDVALTGPGEGARPTALVLAHDGRPVIATYDHDTLKLITCQDFGCARHDSVDLAKPKERLNSMDLAIRRDRRPVLLWRDNGVRATLHLTTCGRPLCGR